jgi:hypothetical protein
MFTKLTKVSCTKAIALLIVISGCSGVNQYLDNLARDEVFYKEIYQSKMISRGSYTLADSIEANHFLFCSTSGKDGRQKDLVGKRLHINKIASQIKTAIQKSDLPIKVGSNYSCINSDELCEKSSFANYPDRVLKFIEEQKSLYIDSISQKPQLMLFSNYGAYWDYEYIHAARAGWVSTDRRLYRINRDLLTILFEHDSIAYMNYYYHRDTVFVNDGHELEFEFPQEIMDSLVTLTLKDYKDRLN